jgi:hypothetical protein
MVVCHKARCGTGGGRKGGNGPGSNVLPSTYTFGPFQPPWYCRIRLLELLLSLHLSKGLMHEVASNKRVGSSMSQGCGEDGYSEDIMHGPGYGQ